MSLRLFKFYNRIISEIHDMTFTSWQLAEATIQAELQWVEKQNKLQILDQQCHKKRCACVSYSELIKSNKYLSGIHLG